MNINKDIAFDFDKICRVCCTISDESMMPVFKMNFHKKIMSCTQIQVWQNDGLPNKICKKCIAKLHISYQFKRMCENSDIQLREYKRRCIDEGSSDSENEDIAVDDKQDEINTKETQSLGSNQVETSHVEMTTLNVPQEFTYQDCIPLPDTRHYDTLQNITLNTSDMGYDPHIIFGGSSINSVNLTSQNPLHNATNNYGLQNVNTVSKLSKHYNINNVTHTSRMVSPSQMLNMENSNEQANTDQEYMEQVEELSTSARDIKNDKKTLPNSRMSKKEILKAFYKKCEEENRCPICNKIFGATGKLTRHMKTHGEKPFKCKTCKKAFTHMGNYRVHLRIHNDERPFRCGICQRGCRQQQDLDKHLRTHTGERPHQCDICQRAFSTSSNLVVHKRTHSGEKPYVCCVCHKTFCQSNELSKHMRVHTGEKSHTCSVCGRGFNGASTLSVHMRIHTGQKPYVCHICDKGFSQSSGLAVHLRIHMSQSDLRCTQCPQSFSTHEELEQHIMTHNPKTLYCMYDGCSKRFSKPHNLERHIKIHESRKLQRSNPYPQQDINNSSISIALV